jgi:hypothetical protein
MAVDQGRMEDARTIFEHLAANDFGDVPRDVLWLVAITILSEVCAALDDGARAAILYDLLLPYADRNLVMGNGVATTGSISRNLGLLAAAMGRTDESFAHFEAALVMNMRMAASSTPARCSSAAIRARTSGPLRSPPTRSPRARNSA